MRFAAGVYHVFVQADLSVRLSLISLFLGGGADEDNPHESSVGSLESFGGGADEDISHEPSLGSLSFLGCGAGDNPHESSVGSLYSLGGGADENNYC